MLTLLAYAMIAVFMTAVMSNRLSALIALILIPMLFALIGGFGPMIPDMVVDGLRRIAPTAALLLFAILYFGLMIDVGLFDPLVRLVVRICHGDPLRVIVGSALLAMVVSLDGDGSTTFLICVTAMMPLHRSLGIRPLILPAVTILPNAIINIAPWGGPTARVMASLHLEPSQVFVPLIPAIVLACCGSVMIAFYFGLKERQRLAAAGGMVLPGEETPMSQILAARRAVVGRPLWLQMFNLALTAALLVMLVADVLPLALMFMIAFAIGITVNFPRIRDQRERIEAHAGSALSVVAVIFGAGIFTGILQGTGMTDALAKSVIYLVPASAGNFIPLITAVVSGPFTFFLSNDAFYFGVVPVLAEAARAYNIPADVIARASLVGQPMHMLSPLVPALYVLTNLSEVETGSLQRFALPFAAVLAGFMLVGALLTGAVPLG